MKRTHVDPCLLYKHENGTLKKMVVVHVDDGFMVGSESFLALEEEEGKQLVAKPRKRLKNGFVLLNGTYFAHIKSDGIRIAQLEKIDKLTTPRTEKTLEFKRTLPQFIEVTCRLDICASVSIAAPGNEQILESIWQSIKKNNPTFDGN